MHLEAQVMHRKMKVITLRNLAPGLARKLHERSQQAGTSLARTVVHLLEERLGIAGKGERVDADDGLDALAGSWSQEQADEFDSGLAQQRTVDPDFWR